MYKPRTVLFLISGTMLLDYCLLFYPDLYWLTLVPVTVCGGVYPLQCFEMGAIDESLVSYHAAKDGTLSARYAIQSRTQDGSQKCLQE